MTVSLMGKRLDGGSHRNGTPCIEAVGFHSEVRYRFTELPCFLVIKIYDPVVLKLDELLFLLKTAYYRGKLLLGELALLEEELHKTIIV